MPFRGLPPAPVFVNLAQQVFEFRPLLRSQNLANPVPALLANLFVFRIEFFVQSRVAGARIIQNGLNLALLVRS